MSGPPLDPIERDRAELIATIDRGEQLTAEQLHRVAEIAAGDATRPLDPFQSAVRVLLDEAAAATDRDPAPGLSIADLTADPLVVLTADGQPYTTIPRATLNDLVERFRLGRGN